MTDTQLAVDGMSCEACRRAVGRALELSGVAQVDVSLDEGIAEVTHAENVSVEALVRAVEEAGYEARSA